jgi:hypothetical protein
MPWSWVVTRPLKLGFGMSQSANRTGMEPEISIPFAVYSAVSANVTCLVCPCRVRSADAV